LEATLLFEVHRESGEMTGLGFDLNIWADGILLARLEAEDAEIERLDLIRGMHKTGNSYHAIIRILSGEIIYTVTRTCSLPNGKRAHC
jgi:hypothetical protein